MNKQKILSNICSVNTALNQRPWTSSPDSVQQCAEPGADICCKRLAVSTLAFWMAVGLY